MKKGKFSLILALVLLFLGAVSVTLGILSGLEILPSLLSRFALFVSGVLSVTCSVNGMWEFGALLLAISVVILLFRQRKPFSLFLAVFLVPIYFTLMAAYRVYGSIPIPSYFPDEIATAHPGLLYVLFVLEILLSMVLLSAVKGLDQRWAKKRDLNRKMLEKEGVLKSKETIEEEKLLKRQKKLNAVEEKKRAQEEARYEKERAKAEKAENEAKEKQAEKDRRKYEKDRERAEEKRQKEELRAQKKALKEKDRLLEESQSEREKSEAKSAKASRKGEKLREKERREAEAEEKRRAEEEIGPAPEYSSGIANPNTPLVFPDFDPMPELHNIVSHGEREEEPEILEEVRVPRIENSTFMENLKSELEKEEEETFVAPPAPQKKKYSYGGMLEATLESFQEEKDVTVTPPRGPIIGFDDEEEKTVGNAPHGSIAPSNLSPDHPRYKYFEALSGKGGVKSEVRASEEQSHSSMAPSGLSPDHPRYKYFEALEKGKVDTSLPVEEKRDDIAPSNLSPDHPRYKYFEALSKGKRVEEKPQSPLSRPQNDPSPSYLAEDHPRRKLFEALEKSGVDSSNVSYIPQRPFTPESEETTPSPYPDLAPKKEVKNVEEDNKAKILESINASVREENLKTLKSIEMEKKEEESSFVTPTATERKTRNVEANEDGTKTFAVKSAEEEAFDFNLVVGVGDLTLNAYGYKAIEERQRALYTSPSPDILKDYPGVTQDIDEYTLELGRIIVQTLADQKIVVELSNIVKGPTVTMFELKLAQGMIISKIKAREDELNYALGGKKIRILAPVPGKQAVGIEVPNAKTSFVGFKDMIYSLRANESYMKMNIPMILGKTITGEPIVIDVAKMPHMIIAGTTGSGKSVCINALINTILYQKGPKDVRLILVDPKVVELAVYDGIPQLLTPVITEPKRAKKALDWLVNEMERRYAMLGRYGVRNIVGLNEKIASGAIKGVEKVPYILLVMDEFADIIAMLGKEMDIAIGRIAAKARAAGIHMILATQRPSSDVITGTLKSNLPGRIAFAVSSGINSRVILDEMGAENLLGKGDMLLLDPSAMGTKRIQGAFLSDGEVEGIASFSRDNNPVSDHLEESIFEEEENFDDVDSDGDDFEDGDGDLYEMAKKIVFERKSASASYLQRRLKIGYNRAARIVEMMEEDGIVGPANGSKPREVLRFD